jgi:Carboxypeptidase regulatory-like domain
LLCDVDPREALMKAAGVALGLALFAGVLIRAVPQGSPSSQIRLTHPTGPTQLTQGVPAAPRPTVPSPSPSPSSRPRAPQPPAPPRDRASPAPNGTAVVRGLVVGADTGWPLRRARVRLSGPELGPEGRTASTDADGRYEFTDLPAGRFNLSAERSRYLFFRYGQRRPLGPGRSLQVADGQILDVDMSMIRMGVISGRIADDLGDPMTEAAVFVLRTQYFHGRRQLSVSGTGSTDDDGEYVIGGLPPGTYIVVARTAARWSAEEGGRQPMGFAPTYFGGTTNAAEARRVIVESGQEAAGTDVALVPGRAVTVSGTAFDSRGQPVKSVQLVQQMLGPGGGSGFTAGLASISASGTFVVENVAPGDYTLQASAPGEEASIPIVIEGAEVQNVSVVTTGGWSISGSITTDSGLPPRFPKAQLMLEGLRLTAFTGFSVFDGVRGRRTINDDWTFSVTGIVGPARLSVVVPDGWAVKALLRDGRDVADTPLDPPAGGALSGVQLVLTDRITSLTGQLVDDRGQRILDGTVIVFPADSTMWFEYSRRVRVVSPDQRGTYRIKGLPPGDYLAIAMDDVERGAWDDPKYLGSLRDRAQKVRLEDGASRTLPLKLVSP